MHLSAGEIAQDSRRLQELIEEYITPERVRRILRELSDVPAPSTASSVLRGPIIRKFLAESSSIDSDTLRFIPDFERTGNAVILTGDTRTHEKPIWFLSHLDTVSYLVTPSHEDKYRLVPFCHHLVRGPAAPAKVYRFVVETERYEVIAAGKVSTENGKPVFTPFKPAELIPGDRVVLSVPYSENPESGEIVAHVDNAGSVAALCAIAPVFAEAGVNALFAFTDEEEGPHGSGNQVIGRGGSRLTSLLPPPDLAIVTDVQQGESRQTTTDGTGESEPSALIGEGAVLAEFSSLARGAVTPPHLYVLARHYARLLREFGVEIQESNNTYTSRSDDVSVMLKTPNILLLGFPGINRHCDNGLPGANMHDILNLARSLVYFSLLPKYYASLRTRIGMVTV